MFSYALLTGSYKPKSSSPIPNSLILLLASAYFHTGIPVHEQEDAEIDSHQRKCLTWMAESQGESSFSSSTSPSTSRFPPCEPHPNATVILNQVLENDNLYDILGVSRSATLDRLTLRRAYLSRSRACHPEYVVFANIDA
jgi:hypothetical protein